MGNNMGIPSLHVVWILEFVPTGEKRALHTRVDTVCGFSFREPCQSQGIQIRQ